MNIVFVPQARNDYLNWQTADRTSLKRTNRLIADTCRSPYEGIGKPEPLKYGLVHRVVNDDLQILQARYHYE
ncbi:Txe/YoeB family addiction module toxin [Mycobacterium sp. LTG2003]